MGKLTRCISALLACGTFLLIGGVDIACAQVPIEVSEDFVNISLERGDLAAWRSHIEPADSELKWLKIPWLPTFSEGIVEGAEAAKPILLWTMNGHPLGCT